MFGTPLLRIEPVWQPAWRQLPAATAGLAPLSFGYFPGKNDDLPTWYHLLLPLLSLSMVICFAVRLSPRQMVVDCSIGMTYTTLLETRIPRKQCTSQVCPLLFFENPYAFGAIAKVCLRQLPVTITRLAPLPRSLISSLGILLGTSRLLQLPVWHSLLCPLDSPLAIYLALLSAIRLVVRFGRPIWQPLATCLAARIS